MTSTEWALVPVEEKLNDILSQRAQLPALTQWMSKVDLHVDSINNSLFFYDKIRRA